MKTIVGKIALVAVVTCVMAPLVSVAQNLASQMGASNRGVEQFTLLTGPNLLSPAERPLRTSGVTAVPASINVGTTPSFRFVPATERFLSGDENSLRLMDRKVIHPLSRRGGGPASASESARPPTPESLRFESTVPRTPVALPSETVPAPKPSSPN